MCGGNLGIPNDLRKMDEEQFVEVFNLLRDKTKNFTEFTPKLLIENNQFLLILRCSFGLSRSSFAKKLGVHHQSLRHVESGRKQNRISSIPIANKWTERIQRFLNKNSEEIELSKALIFWRNFKFKQFGDSDRSFQRSLKRELSNLKISKDIREINKDKFIKLFNFVKEKTKGFRVLRSEILTCRSDLLLIIRCGLGLSQKELAQELGTTKCWVRHTEAGRNRIIHVGPANRWIPDLERLMKKTNFSLKKALKFWSNFKFAREQDFPDIKNKKSSVSELSENGLKKWFTDIKKKTKSFNKFEHEILINQSYTPIFR